MILFLPADDCQGQSPPTGPAQLGLAHYCDQADVDIIPIGFIDLFPKQANGLVEENFSNQCWGPGYANYTGPGDQPQDNFLYTRCPYLQQDIYYCQTQTNKKILLSLGGANVPGKELYDLSGAADGEYLADFLWGAYGPIDQQYNEVWVAAGSVRPLDRGLYNTDLTMAVDFDGFDFDIEVTSSGKTVSLA